MDLPGESETRRRESSRTPAVINRRNTPVNTMYAVGFLCLQAELKGRRESQICLHDSRADEDLRSVLPVPRYGFHHRFVSSSRLGPKQKATFSSFLTVSHVAGGLGSLCVCGQDGGQKLRSPSGSGQQPWQEKAGGCLVVDFLWFRWGGLPCC
ncbi:hypothetical protein D5F01_LYC20965 [Larimichthys crocea]|uniref:Uncharacterized protein n=1 Tax=Larimichthys crocea TaxID=215358 RepID=A0A6G0HMH5_LARCR|nr:hypothetical protein D5F01_LYC20965 [Larimichthys crocea]